MKGTAARVRGPIKATTHWVSAAVRRILEVVRTVAAKVAAVASPILNFAWRLLLVTAGVAMPVGGALMAVGQETTSDTVVTAAFALGILAVPCWVGAIIAARLRESGTPTARASYTVSPTDAETERPLENLSSRADKELSPDDLVLPREPA